MSTPGDSGVQPPAQIGYYTYGEPLDVKFGWLSGKPGMAAVAEAAATLGDMGNLYTGSQDFVTAALREADVEWHGRAAESAGHALRTLAGRGGVAGTAGAGGGTSLEGYGQSFEELRSQVHYEQPGVLGWDDALLPGGSVRWMADQYRIVEANRNADATAVLAFRNHESVTRTALDTFPTLEAAPPVVADIGAAAPPGPGGLPGVGPFGPGGAGGAPGGLTSATAGGPGAAAVAGATPLPDGAVPGTSPPGAVPSSGSSPAGALAPAGASPGGGAVPASGGISPSPGAPAPPPPGAGFLPLPRPSPAGAHTGAAPGAALPGSITGAGAPATLPGAGPAGRLPSTALAGTGLVGTGATTTRPAPGGLAFPGAAAAATPGLSRPALPTPAPTPDRPAGRPPSTGPEFASRILGTGSTGGTGLRPPDPVERSTAGLNPRGPFGGAETGGPGQRATTATTTLPPAEPRSAPTRGPLASHAAYPPFLGTGAAAGTGPTERRTRYWIPSSEPFEVDVPYTPPVIGAEPEAMR
jgi:hypothetical protein